MDPFRHFLQMKYFEIVDLIFEFIGRKAMKVYVIELVQNHIISGAGMAIYIMYRWGDWATYRWGSDWATSGSNPGNKISKALTKHDRLFLTFGIYTDR